YGRVIDRGVKMQARAKRAAPCGLDPDDPGQALYRLDDSSASQNDFDLATFLQRGFHNELDAGFREVQDLLGQAGAQTEAALAALNFDVAARPLARGGAAVDLGGQGRVCLVHASSLVET